MHVAKNISRQGIEMSNFSYPVDLVDDTNGTVLVTFPDVPEANTFGDGRNEALLRAVEALETALEFYTDDGKDLPRPSPARGRPVVTPEAMTCAKLALYQSMLDKKIRKSDLARKLNWHMPQIDRVLDLHHASKLNQVETALRAVGKRIKLEVCEA